MKPKLGRCRAFALLPFFLALTLVSVSLALPGLSPSAKKAQLPSLHLIGLLGHDRATAFRKPRKGEMDNEFYGSVAVWCENTKEEWSGSGQLVRGRRGVKLLAAGHTLTGSTKCRAVPIRAIAEFCKNIDITRCDKRILELELFIDVKKATIGHKDLREDWAVVPLVSAKNHSPALKEFLKSEKIPVIKKSWSKEEFSVNEATKEVVSGDGVKYKIKMIGLRSADNTVHVVEECLVYPKQRSKSLLFFSDCPTVAGMSGAAYMAKSLQGFQILCLAKGSIFSKGVDTDKAPYNPLYPLYPLYEGQGNANFCQPLHSDLVQAVHE